MLNFKTVGAPSKLAPQRGKHQMAHTADGGQIVGRHLLVADIPPVMRFGRAGHPARLALAPGARESLRPGEAIVRPIGFGIGGIL